MCVFFLYKKQFFFFFSNRPIETSPAADFNFPLGYFNYFRLRHSSRTVVLNQITSNFSTFFISIGGIRCYRKQKKTFRIKFALGRGSLFSGRRLHRGERVLTVGCNKKQIHNKTFDRKRITLFDGRINQKSSAKSILGKNKKGQKKKKTKPKLLR